MTESNKSNDKSNNNKFHLSQTFLSDGEPVRSITSLQPSSENSSNDAVYTLLAGSQGGLLSTFAIPSSDMSISPGGESTIHPHQISSLVSIPTEDIGGGGVEMEKLKGGYVSGCKDYNIRVFDKAHSLVGTLSGHENAVTSLSFVHVGGTECLLVSGSWDGTAKLWDLNTMVCVSTLSGHENTVSVCGLIPSTSGIGKLATGSAGLAQGNAIRDHTVRMWDVQYTKGDIVAKVDLRGKISNDHDGPIRGLALGDNSMLVSCSNDGTCKIRDLDGKVLDTLVFPPGLGVSGIPMLLDVTGLNSQGGGGGGGGYAAAGEDGSLVIWSEGQSQVIPHPNCIWSVIALPNGDLATACHDGHIRIFSRDETRKASTEEIARLDDAVSEARSKSSSGPSNEEIAKLPKWEMNALQQGRSEGQVQVFNKNGKAIAAQWSATSGTWIEVGEVTGTNQNAGSIDGVSYDHVFPIEIDQVGGGVAKLQIGYNNGENPFVVAQKFIDDYELDQNYLAQIADYIRQRVGDQGPTLGMDTSSGSSAGAAAASAANVQSGPVPMDVTPSAATPKYKHLPMKGYKSFETGTEMKSLTKIVGKIREFNTSLTTNLPDHQVTTVLDSLIGTLSKTNRYHATKISDEELDVIRFMSEKWDCARCFPALDVARLTVLHPDASKGERRQYWDGIIQLAFDKCQEVTDKNIEGTAAIAVPMLSLRLFANCFRGGSGSLSAISSNMKRVLGCAESFALSTNKNIRLSVSTVVLNSSSYMLSHEFTDHDSSTEQILSVVGTIIGSGLYETEATVRTLVALGTVLLVDDDAKKQAKALNMSSMVTHAVGTGQHGEKAKGVAEEIRSILE